MLKVIVTALTLTHGDGLPAKAPDAVGMSASRLASIDRVVQRGITAGGYPGAAVVVGRKGAAVWQKGFGKLSWSVDDRQRVDLSATYRVEQDIRDFGNGPTAYERAVAVNGSSDGSVARWRAVAPATAACAADADAPGASRPTTFQARASS